MAAATTVAGEAAAATSAVVAAAAATSVAAAVAAATSPTVAAAAAAAVEATAAKARPRGSRHAFVARASPSRLGFARFARFALAARATRFVMKGRGPKFYVRCFCFVHSELFLGQTRLTARPKFRVFAKKRVRKVRSFSNSEVFFLHRQCLRQICHGQLGLSLTFPPRQFPVHSYVLYAD